MRRASRAVALCALLAAICPPLARAQSGAPNETPSRQPKLTKAPKIVQFAEAAYPESEKAASKTASVVLQIAISETGSVQDAAVVESAGPAFDAAALEAVKRFIFEPAEIDNKPSPVKITYRYDFVFKEEPKGPVVNFEGIVRNRATKKPIAGVKVTVAEVGEATTDEAGHFQFEDAPLGKHAVTLTGEGLTTISTEENIEEGKHVEVKYSVEPIEEDEEGGKADLEIVVVAPKLKKEVVATAIKVEEGRRVPGTQGDTLKVVQNLPGVARASFSSGALIVWGASPQDTRVYIDGMRIPLLYHGGGLRSTINSDMVKGIELAPGGYGAEYGRGLGGLVTVETRAPRPDRFHGYVAADVIDSSAMIETPIGDKTRVAIAGRKSYLQQSLNQVTSKDIGEFISIPTYYDTQLKIVRELGTNETVELFSLLSDDRLTRTVTNSDPAQVKREESRSTFGRVVLSYKKQLDDGSSVFVSPSIGQDHFRTISRFGGAPAELDITALTYATRAGYRGKVLQQVVLSAGVDVEGATSDLSRRGSLTLPAREGDIHTWGQPPGDSANVDDWQTTVATIAPYGQADVSFLGDKLHVVPGLRIEPYVTGGSRVTPVVGDTPSVGFLRESTALDPRVALRFQATPQLLLKAAFGRYHQSPEPEDLSAVFGNPSLGISSATHYLAGANYRMTDQLSFEVVGFYSKSDELVSRSASKTPVLAEALVQAKEGRAYGGQALLRQELARGFFGWASYSLIRSERRDHPNLGWRLFDFDQTHVATIVASYELGLGFEVGARFRYATGFPRTNVVGAFLNTRRDVFEPVFDTHQNGIRIPAFIQGDVRVSKRFQFGEATKLEAYLDVQNVTNRQNPEEIVYNYDYSKKGQITGLPILPVFGARMEW